MSATRITIGLDVGGSTTELCAVSEEGSDQMHSTGPGANLQQQGIASTAQLLADLLRNVLPSGRSVDQLSVCAGVAGAGRPEDQTALADRLRQALVGVADRLRVVVVHDGTIALDAAFGAASGVVVIAGTGSIVCARTPENTVHRVGGWGARLGDAGSGRALGRAGLRAVAAAFDGGPETRLQERICEHYDIDGRDALLRRVYQDEVSLPEVAPLVLDAADGDPVAAEIVDAQTADLARQVEWLHRRADTVAPHVALHGGLFQNERYTQRFRQWLHDRLPGWTVEALDETPCLGALRRARRLDS